MFSLFLDLLVLTVASEKTDGFKRFIDSANLNGLKTKVSLFTIRINCISYFFFLIFFLLRFLAWRSRGKEAI